MVEIPVSWTLKMLSGVRLYLTYENITDGKVVAWLFCWIPFCEQEMWIQENADLVLGALERHVEPLFLTLLEVCNIFFFLFAESKGQSLQLYQHESKELVFSYKNITPWAWSWLKTDCVSSPKEMYKWSSFIIAVIK